MFVPDMKQQRIFLSFFILILSTEMLFSRPSGELVIPTEDSRAPSVVIVVGDVHGDFDGFCTILKRTGLIDEQHRWTGSKSVLVQTGDLIDRGSRSREVMELLISLEKMAKIAGGRVIPLLGNHEIMNLVGDLRYVSSEDYAHYADATSEQRRKAGYHDYAIWRASHEDMLRALQQPVFPASEEEWMAKHPSGFLEHHEAFGADGEYGIWLRNHAAIAKINDTVFVHGGIDPALMAMKLDEINARVHQEIAEFDAAKQYLISQKIVLPFFTFQEIIAAVQAADRVSERRQDVDWQAKSAIILGFNNSLSMGQDGPLWYRGYDHWTEEEGLPQVERILAAYNAKHIIVGHTVQQTARIRSRFAGRVFLIDTGMLAVYWRGGRPSALEIRDAIKFTAMYPTSEELLFEEELRAPTPAESNPFFSRPQAARIPHRPSGRLAPTRIRAA